MKQIKIILEGGNVADVQGLPEGYEAIVWDDFLDGLDEEQLRNLHTGNDGTEYYQIDQTWASK